MENLRAFKLTYFGATDTKGARVKITDMRFKKSVILNRDYYFNDMNNQAKYFLRNDLGISIDFQSEFGENDILLTRNFEIQLTKTRGGKK